MRLGYLTGRYPGISHTFILGEVRALRAAGVEIDTFSIWTTDPAELLAAADRDEAARTFNVLPLRPLAALAAHARALARSPAGYAATFATAMRIAVPGLRGRLHGLSWFVEAMVLWRELERRGIRHVHVHLGGTGSSVALLITRFGRATGGSWSWSMTVHGPSEFYDVVREGLARKVREAVFVVAISDFARSQLLGLVDTEHHAKIHVVHCGIDTALFREEADARAAAGAQTDAPLRTLTVARLSPVKGQEVLLRALAELAADGIRVEATLVGDGPMRATLEALSAQLGVADRVRFAGAVGQDRIRELYAQADVFALTSFAEGVPVVLMEAMAMRLPVVASNVMGTGELVDDGRTGLLVRPGRPDLVADALRRLHASPELRASLGGAAREAVESEFCIRDSARRLARLYETYALR
jgi:colanic acid/amylovoran biosynthesis glycosyltransferase